MSRFLLKTMPWRGGMSSLGHRCLFVESNMEIIRSLKNDLEARQFSNALRKAHAIKGSALMIGAQDIAAEVHGLWGAIENEDMAAATTRADAISSALCAFENKE